MQELNGLSSLDINPFFFLSQAKHQASVEIHELVGSAIIIIHNLHIAEEELHSSNGIQQPKIFCSVLDSIIGFSSGI